MISIVVPAYNEEKLIRECLESLIKQQFKDKFEIIVVDNGSKDKTVSIAQDMGVRVVSCPRKGVAYARQAGAEAARGEIIVQADADTIYPPWWLGRIQKQFKKHPKAVAVAGTFIYKNPPWWAIFEYFLRVFFGYLSSLVFGRPLIISGANLAFYKNALTRIGGYNQNAYSMDQIDISNRLSRIGKVIYDGRSYCATSERAVAKPTFIIFIDFVQHLGRFGNHLLVNLSMLLKKRSKKMASISALTYLKVLIPAVIIGLLCYGYFVPASPVFGKVYAGSNTPAKLIALTFDDGPNEPYTSEILDILDKYDVKATFFVIGYNVQLYPDTVKRILEEGSVIGNHSYSHNANHALSFNYDKDIMKAQQAIFDVSGVNPHLYRPPHGKKSPWELVDIKRAGFAEILWNISTNELSGRSPEFLADQIVKKSKPGGIILLHDGYGKEHGDKSSDKSDTVAMLPIVIERLEAEGYTFITVPELFNIPAYDQVVK